MARCHPSVSNRAAAAVALTDGSGCNMRKIADLTGAKIRIRGRGSGLAVPATSRGSGGAERRSEEVHELAGVSRCFGE